MDSSPPLLLLLWPGTAGVRPWGWTGHCQGGCAGARSAGVELEGSDGWDEGSDGSVVKSHSGSIVSGGKIGLKGVGSGILMMHVVIVLRELFCCLILSSRGGL